jgi:phytoene dehydrogenase-like protein
MGTGYVLLHHVLGGVDGHRGVWAFVLGGMGGVSLAIARAAREASAVCYVNAVRALASRRLMCAAC